jgi:hypothetical protein
MLADEHEVGLDLLALCIGCLEVLIPVTHRPATGFRKPQGSIISCSHQVVTQMRQTTTKLHLVDCCDKIHSHLEGQ